MSVLEVTEMQKSLNLPLNSCSEFSFYEIDKEDFINDVFQKFLQRFPDDFFRNTKWNISNGAFFAKTVNGF